MERRINILATDDLRAGANQPYKPDQPLPSGAFGLFGPDVPIGSVAYAAADARAISPKLTPPPEAIPGWRVSGSLWRHQRFVARIPKQWNGRLIVAGTPAQRSEFASDLIWSDPLLERGYAYVCGNKSQGDGHVILTGEARLEVGGAVMPRFFTPEKIAVSFWQHSPGNRLERWIQEFFAITDVACEVIEDVQHRAPEAVYAIGLSNGGGEVRFALERSDRYAGGLAWNAVLWSPEHNLLAQLPQAIAAMEQREPERLQDLGFPADVHGIAGGSLYEKNYMIYWSVTSWLHAMLVDPDTSIAYADVAEPEPAETWSGRMGSWRIERAPEIAQRIAAYPHTGAIRAKMVDLASEYDHLLPPQMHFYPYAQMVAAAGQSELYRSEMIENAQHVDAWSEDANYPQLRPGHPRALAALDDLVRWVEG